MDDFSPDLSFSSLVATLLREPIVGKKMPGWATVKQMAAMAVILKENVSYRDIVINVHQRALTFRRAP
jgi:hypothetical protein